MTVRSRKRWLIGIGAAAVLTFAAWRLLNPRTHDPYPFLARQSLAHVAVLRPGSWPASEVRVYSWKQSWTSVAQLARRELPSFGLKERPKGKTPQEEAVWMGPLIDGGPCGINSETTVSIVRGRCRELRESKPLTDEDPEWVTVLVTTFLDESWINVVRYTFFPMPE